MQHTGLALIAGLILGTCLQATALATQSAALLQENPTPALSAELTSWKFDGYALLLEVPEPSGLCFHPVRNTLFIVDDGELDRPAGIFELSLDAEVIAQAFLGTDLEGICYCPLDGMLYVADEIDERVYIVDPAGLRTVGSFQVSRSYGNEEVLVAGGNGFEGIEYIPASSRFPEGDCFILLNQDDPHALVRVDRSAINLPATEPVALSGFWPVAKINTGELHYDQAAGELWVIHSWMNVMEVLDIRSMAVLRWEVFPGAAQEAVTVDGEGRLWVGYDLGGIARYLLSEVERRNE